MIKAIRIGEDLNSFLREHPEIRIIKNNEKVTHLILPEDANINYLVIIEGTIQELNYTYNGETFHYESKEETQ